MRMLVAIDGACRRNGKPDCVSASGVFIHQLNNEFAKCASLTHHEHSSTNQRGELHALRIALDYISKACTYGSEVYILTDSEYIFNAMTKEWYINWANNDWRTRDDTTVKNKDIWEGILACKNKCGIAGVNLIFYHIKGHCISFGKVTATKLLDEDPTGTRLYWQVSDRYDAAQIRKADVLNNAQGLSVKNNGYKLPPEVLKLFVVSNTVVDAIATREVDAADLQS